MNASMKRIENLGEVGERVAANIATLRLNYGMTYERLSEELAKATGRDVPTLAIRRVEAFARRVDVDDLSAFADVFKVRVGDLVTRTYGRITRSQTLNHAFGQTLRSERMAQGLTAQQLADRIPGMTRSGIAKIEAGVRDVLPFSVVLDLPAALGVDYSKFIDAVVERQRASEVERCRSGLV